MSVEPFNAKDVAGRRYSVYTVEAKRVVKSLTGLCVAVGFGGDSINLRAADARALGAALVARADVLNSRVHS